MSSIASGITPRNTFHLVAQVLCLTYNNLLNDFHELISLILARIAYRCRFSLKFLDIKMSDQELALKVEGLSKFYGTVKAVDNLSFEVPQGVICGFVGPNGSGKTTTIRTLATLLKPDEGTASIMGLEATNPIDAKEVRHLIGFMPDYFGLYTDMTAGEYLDFFAAAYRISLEERIILIDDILTIIGLSDKKDTLIAGLSRGMQQRLSLGRCLVHSPKVLLLDEPASGLDPRARIELMELLKELKSMGKTIFISSHILSELHNLCDSVVIIDHGKLVFAGSIHQAAKEMHQGVQFMELTILENIEFAEQILKELEGVTDTKIDGETILVEFSEKTSGKAIIRHCVKNDIELEEARLSESHLEEIFMSMTKNKTK